MGLWQSLKTSLRCRAVIKRASEDEEVEAVRAFLQDYPEKAQYIAAKALNFCEGSSPWYSLLLAIGLSMADSPQAIKVLKKLVEVNFPGWARLNQQQVQIIVAYLQKANETDVFDQLLKHLNHDQLIFVLPNVDDPQYLTWFKKYLGSGQPVDNVKDQLANYAEALAFKKESLDSSELCMKSVYQSSVLLWDNENIEEALDCTPLTGQIMLECPTGS